MKKRLSMTGMVEDCDVSIEAEDLMAASKHTCDYTASDEGSQGSLPLAEPCDPPKAVSSIRRRSFFVNVENSVDSENTKTPTSQRRRKLFGSSALPLEVDETDDNPKKPNSQQKGLLGSSTKTAATALEICDDCPSERSESTCSGQPLPAARRRSWFGSSSPNSEETIEGAPPRTVKDSAQSVTSESSSSARRRSNRWAETPPFSHKRSVPRAKSMDSPMKKEKGKVLLGGTKSFHGGDASSPNNLLLSPTTPKTLLSLRRLSLGALLGGTSSASGAEDTSKQPHPKTRRRSLTNGVSSTSSVGSVEKSFIGTPPRSSTTGLGGGGEIPSVNPFDLVNKARRKRGLHEYSRNMLMDTLAKQVALDLAASFGNRCTPTSYHGNVGQGETIKSIHETMMRQKGRTARENILAPHFFEIGIGMARSKDGLIFLCQLFK